MRKTLLAVAAAVAIFSIGSVANRAEAMPASTPSALGIVTPDAGLVQEAALVCGYGGCVAGMAALPPLLRATTLLRTAALLPARLPLVNTVTARRRAVMARRRVYD